MKRLKNGLIILFLVILPALLLSCSERYKAPVPFFDGLHLAYETAYYSPLAGVSSDKIIYDVQKLDDNHYKIMEVRKGSALKDEIDEFFVDVYGKVYKSSDKDYRKEFSPIWIPAYLMQIGDLVGEGYQVVGKDKWEKWNVVVVRSPAPLGKVEFYYESNTGLLVGLFVEFAGHTAKQVLVNTNADIPVAQ